MTQHPDEQPLPYQLTGIHQTAPYTLTEQAEALLDQVVDALTARITAGELDMADVFAAVLDSPDDVLGRVLDAARDQPAAELTHPCPNGCTHTARRSAAGSAAADTAAKTPADP